MRRHKSGFGADREVSYFCGVAFALRREVVDRVGLFFEPFFYSCEELDYSWRALRAGYRILWDSRWVVLHRATPVSRPAGRWIWSNARNRVWLAARHLPWRYVLSYAVVWWIYLFGQSLRSWQVRDFARGAREAVKGLASILRERRPLDRATVRAIADLDGRLLY